jgi:hypothetical protein
VSPADFHEFQCQFSKFKQDAQVVSDIRRNVKHILKLTKMKPGLADGVCFVIMGRNSNSIREMVRTIAIHNSLVKQCMFTIPDLYDVRDRFNLCKGLLKVMKQAKTKEQAFFFMNSLLYFIHPLQFRHTCKRIKFNKSPL